MSSESDEGEKEFDPSQKKLDEARKKGEIAKSTDLTTAAAYAGLLLAMLTIGPAAFDALGTALRILLAQSATIAVSIFADSETVVMGAVISEVVWGTLPWFVIPATLAVLSVVVQKAFVVAPSKLIPKLNRISPISGVKNKFGRQGLFEFFKSITKLFIYCIIMAFFLTSQMDAIVHTMFLPPALIVAELGKMLALLMILVLVIAFILGGIDYLWQNSEHMRKNRMSRKELMDEMKQSEGDPMMKQLRRQKGQAIAMNKMLADVPGADVVIVNPTHFAVALRWDRLTLGAPVCVAKGVDEVAARIKEIAFENAVPVHADPPTARALHASVEIGEEIPSDHYQAVAAAIRFAENIRQKTYVN